jgi:hypothetical protein
MIIKDIISTLRVFFTYIYILPKIILAVGPTWTPTTPMSHAQHKTLIKQGGFGKALPIPNFQPVERQTLVGI